MSYVFCKTSLNMFLRCLVFWGGQLSPNYWGTDFSKDPFFGSIVSLVVFWAFDTFSCCALLFAFWYYVFSCFVVVLGLLGVLLAPCCMIAGCVFGGIGGHPQPQNKPHQAAQSNTCKKNGKTVRLFQSQKLKRSILFSRQTKYIYIYICICICSSTNIYIHQRRRDASATLYPLPRDASAT